MKTKPSRIPQINLPFKTYRVRFWCLTVLLSLVFYIGLALQLNVNTIFANSSGPIDKVTGAPGENTCNQTSCHDSFQLNSGSAKFTISIAKNYTLGETLDVTVSFSNTTTPKHGFEITAQDAKDNYVGTFTTVDGNTQVSSNWAKHTLAGNNHLDWNLKWKAPNSALNDPITFYAAGNEANGDSLPTGDHIYTTTAEIIQSVATPTVTITPTPTLQSTPSPSPTVTPTLVCEAKSITVAPGRLRLTRSEHGGMIVTVKGADDCPVVGETVTVRIFGDSKNLISITPKSATTDVNGAATFTITAKRKTGTARVTLETGGLKKSIIIKIR